MEPACNYDPCKILFTTSIIDKCFILSQFIIAKICCGSQPTTFSYIALTTVVGFIYDFHF
jgi:hypothetical protein